jgi:hypothetical protein
VGLIVGVEEMRWLGFILILGIEEMRWVEFILILIGGPIVGIEESYKGRCMTSADTLT